MDNSYKAAPLILASEKLTIGRKVFFLDLKENNRGRFMQITEDVAGRRDRVMIPVEAFKEFMASLERLVTQSDQL